MGERLEPRRLLSGSPPEAGFRLASGVVESEIDQPGNGALAATIGEFVTRRISLEIPGGSFAESLLVEQLDPRLGFVELVSARFSSPALTASAALAPLVSADGRTLSFPLGTVVNLDPDAAAVESLEILYRAVVLDLDEARAGVTVRGMATFSHTGLADPLRAVAAPLQLVEARVTAAAAIAFDGGAEAGSVGDAVTLTLVLANPPGLGGVGPTAHDVAVSWPLPAAAAGSLVASPALEVVDPAGLVTAAAFELAGSQAAGWTLRTRPGAEFDLAADGFREITITVRGTVSNSLVPGGTTRTAAAVSWTTLPGQVGPRVAGIEAARERTGAGGVDDLRTVALADFRAVDFGLSLTVAATSEAVTPAGLATIGEIVRQRLVSLVPEGEISQAATRLRAELPPGLQFLDDGSARVAFVSNGGLSSSRYGRAGGGYVTGGTADGVVPGRAVPASAILADGAGGFTDGDDVLFDFGALVNNDTDGNDEFIVLEFNTLVTNTAANAVINSKGNDLVIRGRVIVDGSVMLVTATNVVTVVAGALAWLTAGSVGEDGTTPAAGPVVAGQLVRQRIDVAAAVGSGRTSLFDLQATADLPVGLTLVPGSVRLLVAGVETPFTDASVPGRLDMTFQTLAPGQAATLLYDVLCAPDLPSGGERVVEVAVRGSTLPGSGGTVGNPTGSVVAGPAGSTSGERNGSGTGPNTIRLGTTSVLVVSATAPAGPTDPPPTDPPPTDPPPTDPPPTDPPPTDPPPTDPPPTDPPPTDPPPTDPPPTDPPPTDPPPTDPPATDPPPTDPPATDPPRSILVMGSEIGARSLPWVSVLDAVTGQTLVRFLAYEPGFRGGVRVSVGDIDGDGHDDVACAPGPGRVGEVRVFRQDGTELTAYRSLPFGRTYRAGIELAVGDLDGDGDGDIVAAASRSAGLVHVFLVDPSSADPVPQHPARLLRTLPAGQLGGVTVAVADVGAFAAGVTLDPARADGRLEIVVGSGPGQRPAVVVYDVSGPPVIVRRLQPLAAGLRGGVFVAGGRYDADEIDDLIVAGGRGGGSMVEVHSGRPGPTLLARQAAFAGLGGPNQPVHVAGVDVDGDGRIDWLAAVQGAGPGHGVRRLGREATVSAGFPGPVGPLRVAASRPKRS